MTKGLAQLHPGCGLYTEFLTSQQDRQLKYFQHILDLRFSEASQNLSSFRQLLFHCFIGGTKGTNSKKQCINAAGFLKGEIKIKVV